MAHWDGAQSQAKMTKIRQNTPTCDVTSRNPPTKTKNIVFRFWVWTALQLWRLASYGQKSGLREHKGL